MEKKTAGSIPIRTIFIICFSLVMLPSVGLIGYLVFSSWISSARHTTDLLTENMNREIQHEIEVFMSLPRRISEENHTLIGEGVVQISEEESRDRFFVNTLASHEAEIYSFSIGTAGGEYYGARRNADGGLEIMRNNAGTGGHSLYYAVKEDMTAGDLAVDAGVFDPRTRAWYQAAVKACGFTYSPVYKHFYMDDLTITAASPVYDRAGRLVGVLGTHVLLSGIGDYLAQTVRQTQGMAFIVERDTGYLIANSRGEANFSVLPDKALDRVSVGDMESIEIREAYERYFAAEGTQGRYHTDIGDLHISLLEYKTQGLDWVIVAAVPEKLLMAEVFRNIQLTVLLVLLAVALSILLYWRLSRLLLLPLDRLVFIAEQISAGDLTGRAEIVREDEVGRLSAAFNQMADKLQYHINHLETAVAERTSALHRANETLAESEEKLRLLLNSTAEAIFGVDMLGICTFCNASCMTTLGYAGQEELLGRDMHALIHHSHPDGTPFGEEDCPILQAIRQGRGIHADGEVYWKKDGTPFYVEYHAYPQRKNGRLVGAVVTFLDITQRKESQEKIRYLSCHDPLTGLHNRRCFEDSMKRLDAGEYLPLSIIFGDLNGLKMTNDIFGHAAGDALIQKAAAILKDSCRGDDAIARVGGDEFVILLPVTDERGAELVMSRIRAAFSEARILAVKCSISLGSHTRNDPGESMEEVLNAAEDAMYRDKTLNRTKNNAEMIRTIVGALHEKNPEIREQAEAVRDLSLRIGALLDLPEPEMKKLGQAACLHDIGKIVLDEGILGGKQLTEEERERLRQHSAVGFRILNLFDETLDLAEAVYSHHESWDGTGYPKGLKGGEIPLMARIIAVAESCFLLGRQFPDEETRLRELQKRSGGSLDPGIVEKYVSARRRARGAGHAE